MSVGYRMQFSPCLDFSSKYFGGQIELQSKFCSLLFSLLRLCCISNYTPKKWSKMLSKYCKWFYGNKNVRYFAHLPPSRLLEASRPQCKPSCGDSKHMRWRARQLNWRGQQFLVSLKFSAHTPEAGCASVFFLHGAQTFSSHRAIISPDFSLTYYVFGIYWQAFKFCTLSKQCPNDA